MPALADHHAQEYTKFLYIGDSGTGKTGSLVSLVAAGYRVRILDTDDGVEVLAQYVREQCPDKLSNVDYVTIRDIYRATPQGPMVKGLPKAFINTLKAMEKWPEDESDPAQWGTNTIFVLDSLSTVGKSAFEWARALNPGARDPRQWYFSAQQALESMVAMLTGPEFKCNVICISHVNLTERKDGVVKGYPNTVGSALGPVVGRYFNTFLLAETRGAGASAKRIIRTATTGTIDLKNPAPFKIKAELPLETGLITAFEALRKANDG